MTIEEMERQKARADVVAKVKTKSGTPEKRAARESKFMERMIAKRKAGAPEIVAVEGPPVQVPGNVPGKTKRGA
jgi:hypothetical protein